MVYLAEGVGFEPTEIYAISKLFKSFAFGRSAIPPGAIRLTTPAAARGAAIAQFRNRKRTLSENSAGADSGVTPAAA